MNGHAPENDGQGIGVWGLRTQAVRRARWPSMAGAGRACRRHWAGLLFIVIRRNPRQLEFCPLCLIKLRQLVGRHFWPQMPVMRLNNLHARSHIFGEGIDTLRQIIISQWHSNASSSRNPASCPYHQCIVPPPSSDWQSLARSYQSPFRDIRRRLGLDHPSQCSNSGQADILPSNQDCLERSHASVGEKPDKGPASLGTYRYHLS